MSERGVFAVDRGIWSDPDFADEKFSEREAFLWLGVYGPARLSTRYLGQAWGWPRKRVLPFVRKMLGCGHFVIKGRHIAAVSWGAAVRHPEIIPGDSWHSQRLRVLVRDGFRCAYCGSSENLHCDHVVPRVQGGLDIDSNLVAACRACNLSKGALSLQKWRGRRQ